MSLILALDLGTSSTRTALFDAQGQRLLHTTAQRGYPLLTDAEGKAELDAEVLKEAVLTCLRQTLEQYRADDALRGQRIEAAGLSCFWHGLLGTDAEGRPLTPVYTWADARPSKAAAQLRKEFSEAEIHQRTGCMLRSSFWPAKLTWLRTAQPALFHQVARWMSVAEWLQGELCTGAHCAIAMATGTGLFNPNMLAWDPALLQRCGVQESQFQTLSDEPHPTSPRWARELPELAETLWFPGLGDGAASNLGSGATRPGYAAINVGTSAAVRIMREGAEASSPLGLFCYRVDARRFLVGGAISNAGNLFAWCKRELQVEEDHAKLEAALAQRPRPEHGLTVLPFWTVERAPTWNEEQTGVIAGIAQHTTSLDLLQAITEATYHRMARIADLLLPDAEESPKFLVSGGIQNSRTAMQRLANVLGRTIYANPEPEASIRGAAIYAMEKLGWEIPEQPLGEPIPAESAIAALYAQERARQTALEERFN